MNLFKSRFGSHIITTAHGTRLQLYITGVMKDVQKSLIDYNSLKMFYIRVQRSPCYGFMTSEELSIYDFMSDHPRVSGKFFCNHPQLERCGKLRFSLEKLWLSRVDSIDKLYEYDIEYEQNILMEEFGAEWYFL